MESCALKWKKYILLIVKELQSGFQRDSTGEMQTIFIYAYERHRTRMSFYIADNYIITMRC